MEGPGISSPGEREGGAGLAVAAGLLGTLQVPGPLTRRFEDTMLGAKLGIVCVGTRALKHRTGETSSVFFYFSPQ